MIATFLILSALLGAPKSAAAADTKALNKSLFDYKILKSREAILRIKISRGTISQKDEFNREFDALKPKIYDAAQVMEYQIQSFERNHGAKKLCSSLDAGVKSLVPACAAKKK